MKSITMSTTSNSKNELANQQKLESIPTFLQCPISLELMTDPVTLSTGHTYDRSSIERWFRAGKRTCPQTRQVVSRRDLVPNLTLKNYIRSWQLTHDVSIPTRSRNNEGNLSTRPLTEEDVRQILDDMVLEIHTLENLKTLRTMITSSHKNRKLICEGGALSILVSILARGGSSRDSGRPNSYLIPPSAGEGNLPEPTLLLREEPESTLLLCEEALGAIVELCMTGEKGCKLLVDVGRSNLPDLSWFLSNGSSEAKFHAVRIVESLIEEDDCLLHDDSSDGLIPGLLGLIRQQALPKAVRPSLRSLYSICLSKRNRSIAVDAGAVAAVLEVLPGAPMEIAEAALPVLNVISKCSEGRSALHGHALCLPVMVKSIAAYSNSASEYAVSILHSLLNNVVEPRVYDEAIKNGLIAKLLMINQIPEVSSKNQKTRELLKILLGYCRSSELCFQTITYSR